MKIKHNKITGAYYEEKTDWLFITYITLVVLAVVIIIGEQSGLISKLLNTI